MDKLTPTTITNDSPLRPFTAEAFIKALRGETVADENNVFSCFLQTNNGQTEIIIKNISVFSPVILTEKIPFDYPITIQNCQIFILQFEDQILSKPLYLDGMIGWQSLSFENSQFDQISIADGACFDIEFRGCEYNEMIQIHNVEASRISFEDGNYFGDVWLQGERFKDLEFSGGIFHKSLRIDGVNARLVSILKGHFNASISFDYLRAKHVEIGTEDLRAKRLLLPDLIDCVFAIRDCQIDYISKKGTIEENGHLLIERVSTKTIELLDLQNFGRFHLSDIKVVSDAKEVDESYLNWDNCVFRNCHLSNVDYLSFNSIVIRNCLLNEIITTSTHIPVCSEKNVYSDDYGGKIQNSRQLEELYNQLYLAMQKQGNRTQEIKYYAEYLEWHRKAKLDELKKHKSEGKSWWWRVWNADWYTPASLWLHKWSSGYGNNWVRAALMMLGVGLLWYMPYALCLPDIDVSLAYMNPMDLWTSFSFFFGYFWSFLLPTHRVSFIPGLEPGSGSLFFDFLGRVSVGFMLYQTIAAFRRFGKR